MGDKAAVRQMLVSHLGRSFRQGRHILRVLYYRPMKNLLPGSALRRSENHIARQIFSALTRVNEENGELEADIAHHWQQLSPTHWRFFLRPGIHFHHGRELEMEDVIASLQRSNSLPLYSHIERIASPTAWTLDVHLTQPDRWLPWLLGQVSAVVLPREWQSMENFSAMPVGTGPYAVVRNNQNQLKIHAFDDYFGYRALIDEVNVWVLPEISEEPNGGLTLQGTTQSEKAVESRLEEGCYYLLFDARSPSAATSRFVSGSAICYSPPICFITPVNSIRATGSRPTVCCPAGTMPAVMPVKNRRDWSLSPSPTTGITSNTA